MRPSWISQVSPNSTLKCLYKNQKEKKTGRGDDVTMEAETGAMWAHDEESRQSPNAGGGREEAPSQPLEGQDPDKAFTSTSRLPEP